MTFNNIATKRITQFAAETYTTELKENRLSYRLLSFPLFLYSDHNAFPKIKPDFIFLMVSHHLQKLVKVPNKGDNIFQSLLCLTVQLHLPLCPGLGASTIPIFYFFDSHGDVPPNP